MKLEGSLDAFSLPDIFQLLSFTKKTGGLHLAGSDADGVVFFTTGQVTGASADGSRQPLARRLIGSGAVEDDALARAVEAAAASDGVGVVKALLDAGAVESDLLRQAVTEQSVDSVFDLLRWPHGDFAFVLDEANPDDVGVALTVERVLADADARREGWETVSKVIPSPAAVLGMPVVLPDDPEVSREEWALLALVDGRRSVGELVDLTGSGQYAVVSMLAALVQRGLLEVREEGDDHVGVVLRRQRLLATLEGNPFTPVVEGSEPARRPEAPGAPGAPEAAAPADEGSADGSEPDQDGPVTDVPTKAAKDQQLVTASAGDGGQALLGGAHVPGDVVPPRPERYLPKRQADFDEDTHSPATRPVHVGTAQTGGLGDVMAATAVARDPDSTVIERDPSVNRSLMLRLIAGVRGL